MSDPVTDTIAALATPPGRGGIGILRVSGPGASAVGEALLDRVPPPRRPELCWFHDRSGQEVDRGLAIFFAAPASYTGEDVLELQGHGGPVTLDILLQAALAAGARLAEPGEFTRRAYLNDKMDLAQAEAVADLIDSATRDAARAAARSLHGDFSALIHDLERGLTELRMHVEAAIDFQEEEVDFLSDARLKERIDDVRRNFEEILRNVRRGQLLRDGMVIVIAGRPNAGKSSLLNRLAGHDAAIVTARPGTTRDVLREDIELDGMPLRVIDTAGIRDSDDPIEQEGVRRARLAMSTADRVLLIVDDQADGPADIAALPDGVPVTVVRNKVDLTGAPAGTSREEGGEVVRLSALTGEGMDALRQHLKECVGYVAGGEGTLIARRRHLDALARAREHLERGHAELVEHAAGEIMAEELRLAQTALGEITGEVSSDDLLGEIFARFCIGK